MRSNKFTVVEFSADTSGQRCGYCKSLDSNLSWGLWAHTMSVREYQSLIDRGWRRCGQYMYKPCMRVTCCPMYTIRCDVGDLHISKSQKKVLKTFYKYLLNGDTPRDLHSRTVGDSNLVEGEMSTDIIPSHMEYTTSQPAVVELDKIEMDTSTIKEGGDEKDRHEETGDTCMPSTSTGKRGTEDISETKVRPRKAKLIRLENKYNKLRSRGVTEEEAIRLTYESKKTSPEEKPHCFENYFPHSEDMSSFTHKFRVELYPVSEFENNEAMLQETHRLYMKYQVAVHGDSPEDCSLKQFLRFLVKSPLFDPISKLAPPAGFGSFHQQYWLDGRLIAVGVIDILPMCVSSVYFFYDPDLRSLSLGTYGCLQEMYFTRGLTQVCPTIKFYYLGYYIHNCPKMNYKGRYCPSFLLCPETFTWHRMEKCLLLLGKNKYTRFEGDPRMTDKLQSEVNLEKVKVLYKNAVMGYLKYKRKNSVANDEEEVTQYAKLVGRECYQNMLLFRH